MVYMGSLMTSKLMDKVSHHIILLVIST